MAIPSWLSLNKTSGDKNSVVDVTASPNKGEVRSYPLVIKAKDLSFTLSCTQKKNINLLDYTTFIVDNVSVSPGQEGGDLGVNISYSPEYIDVGTEVTLNMTLLPMHIFRFIRIPSLGTIWEYKNSIKWTLTEDDIKSTRNAIVIQTNSQHTVTYAKPSYGTLSKTSEIVTYKSKGSCTITIPEETDAYSYFFSGWYADAEYTTFVSSSETLETKEITEDITYYPLVERYVNSISNDITITPTNSGTVSPNPMVGDYDSNVLLTAKAKTGYHFVKWTYNNLNGSGISEVTANPNDFTSRPNRNITAVFAKNIYTVTWNANGGSVSPTSVVKEHGATLGTLPIPTRSNTAQYTYTFKGWFTAASGGTQVTVNTTVNSDVTYYAQWTTTTNSYTHTFNANGGNTPSQSSITKTYGSTLGTLPTCTKNSTAQYSYSFVGWFDTSAASGGTQATTSTTITGSKTWYARFSASTRSYTITASPNNSSYGTVTGGGTYNYGSSVTLKATAKSGYHFVRWSDGNTSASRTITVSGAATYTAVFEADPYLNLDKTELTFDASGGTQVVNVSSNVSWSIS